MLYSEASGLVKILGFCFSAAFIWVYTTGI